ELALYVEQPLKRVRRAPVELVGKGLWCGDVRHRSGQARGSVKPGLGGEVRIVVVARAAGGVAAHIEARIALVLVIECACARADCPFRLRTPCDPQARGEIVVVAIHQTIAETPILYQ